MFHIATLIYLKISKTNKALYSQLTISKLIIFALVFTGFIIGLIMTGSLNSQYSDSLIIIGATALVPLIILGLVWFYQVGMLLMFIPLKLIYAFITRT